MYENIKAKIFNKDNRKMAKITTSEVVLEALCAYRDQLIMSDDCTPKTHAKLMLLHMAIEDTVKKIPVEQ